MKRPERQPYLILLPVIIVLALVFVAGDLVISYRQAVAQGEQTALAQIQLLEAHLNNTLRETDALLTVVAAVSEDSADALRYLQVYFLTERHIANAAVYHRSCELAGMLRPTPPRPPGRLPEELRIHHHERGASTGMYIADSPATGATIWLSRTLSPGCVVMAGISGTSLANHMELIHGDTVQGVVATQEGQLVVQWGAGSDNRDKMIAETHHGLTLARDHRGIVAAMQLQGYPLHASLVFPRASYLGTWYSRLVVESVFLVFGILLTVILFRAATQRQEALQRARERDLLIRETHHRVKNNLSTIDSILSLTASTQTTTENQELISGLRGRIGAISLIHDALYQRNSADTISLSHYCQDLLVQLRETYGAHEGTLSGAFPELSVSPDMAKRIGLIMHELVANAFKYSRKPARVAVAMTIDNHNATWQLVVRDQGPGFPDSREFRQGSLGLTLVEAIASELQATVLRENIRDEGMSDTASPAADLPISGARVTVEGAVSALGR